MDAEVAISSSRNAVILIFAGCGRLGYVVFGRKIGKYVSEDFELQFDSASYKIQDSMFAVHNINRILPKAVCFNGVLGEFERVDNITDCRRDATEARILYTCRRRQIDGTEAGGDVVQTREENTYVLKCKIQSVFGLSHYPLIEYS